MHKGSVDDFDDFWIQKSHHFYHFWIQKSLQFNLRCKGKYISVWGIFAWVQKVRFESPDKFLKFSSIFESILDKIEIIGEELVIIFLNDIGTMGTMVLELKNFHKME